MIFENSKSDSEKLFKDVEIRILIEQETEQLFWKALRVLPAETELTVYRRPRVKIVFSASRSLILPDSTCKANTTNPGLRFVGMKRSYSFHSTAILLDTSKESVRATLIDAVGDSRGCRVGLSEIQK